MNQELGFETIPFEIAPQFQDELFEEEGEFGGRRSFAGGGSRYSRPRSGSGRRSRGATRRPMPRPRPRPRGHWGVVRQPYGFVSEPYSGQREPSASERVRWIQDCLNQAMGLQLPVTGIMGPETRSAVRSFQKQQGLRESGIVGPDTEAAIKAACRGQSTRVSDVGENPEEAELGPLTATLRWIGPPNNPTLFTQAEAGKQRGGGVYIVVESGDGKTIKQILKVGKAPSFRSRFGKGYHIPPSLFRGPADNLRFYLANIVGFVDPHAHIERAIARLLLRSGEALTGSRYVASAPVTGRVEVQNILPAPFLARLLSAYRASGKDVRGKSIPKGKAPYRVYPDALILEPASFPSWEISQPRDTSVTGNVLQNEASIMHHKNCTCPKCQMAGELEWGAAELPGLGEVYGGMELESPFNEAEEIELAAELLSVSNEEELDQFLGKLVKGAWKGIKKVGSVVGKIAKPLGGVLKGVAKAALPFVGGALGSFIPIPGVGTALGSALGGALSKALEMELAELNQEEQEFEIARRFVRTAGTAAQLAAQADPYADLEQEAQAAVMNAARQQVPNLPNIAGMGRASQGMPGRQVIGRWVRRGNHIVAMGA